MTNPNVDTEPLCESENSNNNFWKCINQILNRIIQLWNTLINYRRSSREHDNPKKNDSVEQTKDDKLNENGSTILIIGRSGNGKSSIGNSLLKEKKFETRANCDIQLRDEDFSGNGFKVFDLSGVADSPEDFQVSDDKVCDKIRKILKTSAIDAILFVLKYGVRYTKQEKDAVTRVKLFFGDNVFRNHVILAFSYGDLFDQDECIQEYTFEDWCRQQTGDIKLLFEEVSYRCVLFNNKSMLKSGTEKLLKDFIRCKVDTSDVATIEKQSNKDTSSLEGYENIKGNNQLSKNANPVNKKYSFDDFKHSNHDSILTKILNCIWPHQATSNVKKSKENSNASQAKDQEKPEGVVNKYFP